MSTRAIRGSRRPLRQANSREWESKRTQGVGNSARHTDLGVHRHRIVAILENALVLFVITESSLGDGVLSLFTVAAHE
jgi:hypothetical protein